MGNKEEMMSDISQLLSGKSNGQKPKSKVKKAVPETKVSTEEAATEHKRPGRKSRLEKIGYNDFRTSLNIDRNLYKLMNQIAVTNGLTCKDVMNAAMRLYIELYEKKHGPLTSRESKISADDLI